MKEQKPMDKTPSKNKNDTIFKKGKIPEEDATLWSNVHKMLDDMSQRRPNSTITQKTPISLPSTRITAGHSIAVAVAAVGFATLVFSAGAIEVAAPAQPEETLSNIPQTLSSECTPEQNCKKRYKIQRPKSRKAETCTGKCVTTCIQGGFGSPGEGPFNIRSLSECSDICNLIGDGDDGQ
ncbi:hypothetical protein DH2020_013926 [Rehmannia glutinosa]|uniref:Thionin-like protein n=1 Tax=Rehmannia glutinosa TaxID=99300 RepID=A0ABR0WXF9_REHGL